MPASWIFADNAQSSGQRAIRWNGDYSGGSSGDYTRATFNQYVTIEPVKPYVIQGTIDPVTSTVGRARLAISWYDASNSYMSATWTSYATFSGSTTVIEVSGAGTAPETAVYARLVVQIETLSGGTVFRNTVDFYNMMIRRGANAELIIDGAITADKVAANSITAAKIAAGSIT